MPPAIINSGINFYNGRIDSSNEIINKNEFPEDLIKLKNVGYFQVTKLKFEKLFFTIKYSGLFRSFLHIIFPSKKLRSKISQFIFK